jgi:hypothetical protein
MMKFIRLVSILGFLFFALAQRGLAATSPDLGDAASFSVLGHETITNNASTTISGNLGGLFR